MYLITEKINLGNRSYPVYIGSDTLKATGRLVGKLAGKFYNSKKILLVSDRNVMQLYGNTCISSLEESGLTVITAVIDPGEENKNIDTLQQIYDKAAKSALDRSAIFIALGGGVVGDITGFAAATYMRGVPYLQIPTTLLAQVDSSVGGKTAINHKLGKNLIGSFYQPCTVMIDIDTLATLPQTEYLAGLAEVVKYGVIGDWEFFNRLNSNIDQLLKKETGPLLYAVKTSVSNKARIVESDEQESGRRKILNLGHTFAHALEAATAYRYYIHGEAVLVGIEMAVKLSEHLELLTPASARVITNLLNRIGFKPAPTDLKPETVIEKLIHDKKRQGEDNFFILPYENKEAITYKNPPKEMIKKIITEYVTKK